MREEKPVYAHAGPLPVSGKEWLGNLPEVGKFIMFMAFAVLFAMTGRVDLMWEVFRDGY